ASPGIWLTLTLTEVVAPAASEATWSRPPSNRRSPAPSVSSLERYQPTLNIVVMSAVPTLLSSSVMAGPMSSPGQAAAGTSSSVIAMSTAPQLPQPSEVTSFTHSESQAVPQQYGSAAHTHDSVEGTSQPGVVCAVQQGAVVSQEPQPSEPTSFTQIESQ